MNKKDHLPVLGYGPYFILAMAIVFSIFLYLPKKGFFVKLYLDNIIMSIIGIFLIVLGVIVYILSLVHSRIGTRIKENKLVTNGIYRYIRNPIYAGILYVFTGVLFLQRNLIAIVAFIIFWIAHLIFIKATEEKWLIEKFGNEFLDYMKKTNRFIIWFPKK